MRKITNEELGRPTPEEYAAKEKLPVRVVLDNVRSAQNVGSFFRTGDAFAVEHVALCGITAVPPAREIHKTALGAELTVPWSYHASTAECVRQLRDEGYEVLAVGQCEGRLCAGLRQRSGGCGAGGCRPLPRSSRNPAVRGQALHQRRGFGRGGAVALLREAEKFRVENRCSLSF